MPFKDFINRLFDDAIMARTATYRPQGVGDGYPVRIIIKQPDTVIEFGHAQINTTTHLFEVRTEEVREPAIGDIFVLCDNAYVVQSEPRADRERLVWTLDVYST